MTTALRVAATVGLVLLATVVGVLSAPGVVRGLVLASQFTGALLQVWPSRST